MIDAKDVASLPRGNIRYSVCTLVSDWAQYERLLETFAARGFEASDCEFLYADNRGSNRMDAFAGGNEFLLRARGEYVVFCHQDIELLDDGRSRLDELIGHLHDHDPRWGLCGNAGSTSRGKQVIRITDPWGDNTARGGPYPVRVLSLDENFIVIRRSANLALSADLSGFHWYGSDLCIIADVLGYNAYVIDFHLRHRSPGRTDETFYAARDAINAKYRRAFRPRRQHVVTVNSFFLDPTKARLTGFNLRDTLRRWKRAVWP